MSQVVGAAESGQRSADELAADVVAAYAVYCDAHQRVSALALEWMKAVIPFKVGDVAEIPPHCSHAGKKMRIERLSVTALDSPRETTRAVFPYFWTVRGTVLRKDGSDSQYTGDFNQFTYNRALSAPAAPAAPLRL